MGRKTINGEPMTAAERQRRVRQRRKAALPTHPILKLRWKLFEFVRTQQNLHPDMSAEQMREQLDELGQALWVDEWKRSNNQEPNRVNRYLIGDDLALLEAEQPK